MKPSLDDCRKLLKQYWNYSQFRPLQEDIIASVLEGNDTLALLPTGGGKSICFQIPALAFEGICIVVSPLIALMKDQIEQLQKRQIIAKAIYSGMSYREIDFTLDNCVYGKVKFLYLSPERLKTEIFLERAKKMNISLLAIDEAHCISQWGYDFRPPYLEIAEFRKQIPNVPCIALTATATEDVKIDIQQKLAFKENKKVFQKSFARPNLSYSCFYEEHKEKKLVSILEKVKGSAVVYVQSRRKTKNIAEYLAKHQISADYYHAGLSHQERSKKQEDWINDKTRVIVATNAFGMGIDKPNVRLVVHTELPNTLEAYYQEAGRAGRDEKKAYAVVLYNEADILDLRKRIQHTYPTTELLANVYQKLANYYHIAIGSGQNTSYDFDLEEFHKIFQLNYVETYYALKQLENENLIQFNEAFHSPSKVYITVDNAKLYEIQVANSTIDNFIKALLRTYGGELFNNFTIISELHLAKALNTNVEVIVKILDFLHKNNILSYSPQKDKPQLTFITERYLPQNLPIDSKSLQLRKQLDEYKAEAVIQYVTHPKLCRTEALLAYFGELNAKPCGVCDKCLEKKKEGSPKPNYSEKIKEFLKNNSLTIKDLIQKIQPISQDDLVQELRLMIANEEIVEQDGMLKLRL